MDQSQEINKYPEELLVIEPIIGYRSFIIGYDFPTQVESAYDMHPHIGFYLHGNGTGKDYIWKKGKNIASCISVKHSSTIKIPVFNCECGFYAYKGKYPIIAEAESAKLVIQLMERDPIYHRFCIGYYIVLGKVSLFGKVIEHEYGYRAEFAEIKEIIWIFDDNMGFLRADFLYNKNGYAYSSQYSNGNRELSRTQTDYVKDSLSRFYQLPITDYQQFLNEVDK